MPRSRRDVLRLAASAAAVPAVPRLARAQAYPSRPVHILVGFAAGSAFDILARLIAQALTERLGQTFVVDNRPGAGGTIATEAVTRSRPDGYTLLVTGSPDAINATLYTNQSFSFMRDIVPVAGVGRGPNVMVVAPSFPAKTAPEFIAFAKAHPGQISVASAGVGSESHMCSELFKLMAGVDMVHVPYRGQAPALTDLIGGQVQADFAPLPPSIEYAKAGKLRALAITSSARSEAFPDLPTLAEFLPGYEATLATGLGAPRGTPAEVIERINKEVNAALAHPRIKAQLADLGNAPLPGSPADFGNLVAAEAEKWAKVIRAANLKPE